MNEETIKKALEIFREELVLTIAQLTNLLNCSTITARRYLKKWGAYTSYNMNGCYSILPDIPAFDHNGLWEHCGIRFSKHGNLKHTIIHLIRNAPEGLDTSTISDRLAFDGHCVRSRLSSSSVLRREKFGGRFIYFSTESEIYENQIKKRKDVSEKPENILTDAIAVLVLVETIKYPKLDLPQLTTKLRKRGIIVELHAIRSFFLRHGLLKKTLDSKPFQREDAYLSGSRIPVPHPYCLMGCRRYASSRKRKSVLMAENIFLFVNQGKRRFLLYT